MKKISVIGLGPVGSATAIGFAELGYNVVGVDLVYKKVDKINKLNNKKLKATLDLGGAILRSNISFICVETPTKKNGDINLTPLKDVCMDIGKIVGNKESHIIVIRSTIFPGSLEILRKILEKSSGKKCGKDFELAINPEFLREAHAIKDFINPSFIVVGAKNKKVGEQVMGYYKDIKAKKFIVTDNVAQMIKYVNNSYHALKVVFTNEIASICKELKIDGKKLMGLFCEDTQLNISPYYMKPGKAYGGSCLPKDLNVLQVNTRKLKVKSPVIDAISKSNNIQIKRDEK